MQTTSIKKRVIGVDISNERTTCAIVDIRGNIIASTYFPTIDYPDINRFSTKLSDVIVTLSEANGGYETIRSIGISCPSANQVFRNLRDRIKLLVSELDDRERDVLGASALAWEVPEYSLFK